MSRLNDDLEHLELDYLRHQALSSMTPKKKGSSKRREHDTRQLESDFGIDELLGGEKMPRSKHSGRQRGRSTPEMSREVIKTFSSRPRKPDHFSGSTPRSDHYYSPKFPPSLSGGRGRSGRAPQWGQVGKKHRKRSSSGSSYSSSASRSRSSFSSSRSSSHSRSHSSSSSSHSSSSRSHSSTSSSYSRSSRSSSRSRSTSPRYHRKGRKRSLPLHALPQSYRGQGRENIVKKLKPSRSVLSPPRPPPERSKRPHPSPRSPDGGWYPEPNTYNRRSPRRQPLRPPPPPLPPGPPKRRPHPPPDYFEDEHSYYPHGRHPEYPRSRPRSPPPPRAEQRVVRQVRYPPYRPPPSRDYDKPYRRSPPLPPPPPPPLPPRHGYRSDYMQHGRSDHSYPRERTRHPPEHSVDPRGGWREGREKYYRHHKTGDYSSDEEHVPHKENTLVKSSVKVVNRIHRSMRSRSASPRKELVKRKRATDLRVSSEQTLTPKKLKPRRKSAEAKGSDTAETIKSAAKMHKSDKDGDGADSVPMKGIKQIEPTQVNECLSDKGKPDVMEEKESSPLVSREPGLMDEELDYDENMDELDLYPTESLDVGGGVEEAWGRRPSKSAGNEDASLEKTDGSIHRKRKRLLSSGGNKHSDVDTHSNSCSDDSSHETERVSPHKKHRGSTPGSEVSSNSEEEGNSSPIRSPIRVSPERKETRVVHDTSSHDYRKKSGSTLPVKERLYVSKRTIEEKKRMIIYKNESPSKLRPSLANRLGPSPFRRGTRHDDPHHSSRESHRYGGSYYTGRPSKGDAIAIAQAYRRKKRQEELMGDNELQKAEKPTRRQDQPDSKISTKKSVEDSKDSGKKEWREQRAKQSRSDVKQGK